MDRKDILAAAKAIIDNAQAAARDLTDDEVAQVEEKFQQIEQLDAQARAKVGADSTDLVNRLNHLGQGGATTKVGGYSPWSKGVADKYFEAGKAQGVKALVTGTIDTAPAVSVEGLPVRPTRLLELVPRTGLTENTFEYLRQTVATHNAAPVADGATKPTSIYTFEEQQDRARVIAHLSEKFPIRFATDHRSMMQVLDAQMAVGIYLALEDLIVNGTGVGEEWEGILTVAGTTQVAFATDVPTTLRKARTALENLGVPVTGVAMNPSDMEALDLMREDGAGGGYLMDSDAYRRILGEGAGAPVPSLAVPAGVAIAGDWGTTELRVRETGHTLAATQAGDLFETNQMRLRSEGRYGFELRQPQALAVVDLTAA